VAGDQRITLLLICLFLYFGLGTISGCAFNSRMRDFISQKIVGSYFGKRLAVATAIGAVLTLLAGFAVELGKRAFSEHLSIYSILVLTGGAAGLLGVYCLARIPELRMVVDTPRRLGSVLAGPFRDFGFRRLLMFVGTWNFAINLAAPFFAVYMFKRLGLSIALALVFSVLSQLINVLFFRLWGRLADRFSNKSVLTVSDSLFIFGIFLWSFLTLRGASLRPPPILDSERVGLT